MLLVHSDYSVSGVNFSAHIQVFPVGCSPKNRIHCSELGISRFLGKHCISHNYNGVTEEMNISLLRFVPSFLSFSCFQ